MERELLLRLIERVHARNDASDVVTSVINIPSQSRFVVKGGVVWEFGM